MKWQANGELTGVDLQSLLSRLNRWRLKSGVSWSG